MEKRRRLRLTGYALLTVAVMAAIFILSSQTADESSMLSEGFLDTALGRFLAHILPGITGSGIFTDIRKYAHMFEYFCLGISSALYFFELMRGKYAGPFLYSAGLSVLYACTDEWHQTFVPGRSGMIADVGIDFIGILFGVSAILTVTKLQSKK